MGFITLLWIISVLIRNASIIDPFWGLGYVILAYYYQWQTDAYDPVNWLLLLMVTVWGLRLSGYLTLRNMGKGEDYRYQEFRRTYGPERYWWFSFFQVFLLQGVLMAIVSLPLLGAFYDSSSSGYVTVLAIAGLIVWLIGFLFETIGDYQLTRFKKKSNPGDLLDTGLWRYTRHPNYFGDAMVWWGYGLFSIANGQFWPVLGSLVMTILLMRVSGVSLLERTLKESKPAYKEYMQKTPAFFPGLPKK